MGAADRAAAERDALTALARHQPALAERLGWPCRQDHLRRDASGSLERRWHRAWFALSLPEPAVPPAPGTPDETGFVFGVGDGGRLARVVAEDTERSLIAWDRDPALLRAALVDHPTLLDAVAQGRLELALGVDLAVHAARWRALPRLEDPVLAPIYALERQLLTADADAPPAALLCGGLFVDDIADALGREDAQPRFAVVPFDADLWSVDELRLAVDRVRPRCAVAVNHRAGMAEFFAERDVPLLVWEIDPSIERGVAPCARPGRSHVFTWRRAHVAAFRAAGFPSVVHLPLAGNPERRAPVAGDEPGAEGPRCAVSFVGSSLRENATRYRAAFVDAFVAWRGDPTQHDAADAAIDAALRRQAEATARGEGWQLDTLLEDAFGPFLAAWRATPRREDPIAWIAESAAAEARAGALSRLAEHTPAVWGDAGWETVAGIDWRGPAGHGAALTRIYAATDINLDIGRSYQRDIVTMRVFDALLCGGFVLAEDSPDLHALFDVGREVDSWRHPDELAEKVAFYRAQPEAARAIAAAGREACLARHTIRQRVAQMLAHAGLGG